MRLSECIVNPVRGPRDPRVPDVGILAVNPADCTSFPGLAREYRLRSSSSLFHAGLYIGEQVFLAGPAVGAPMAALCLEKLIALGARRVVLYGWCGSLVPDLPLRALFAPNGGVSEEGTSPHYPHSPGDPADEGWRQTVCALLRTRGFSVEDGLIWTTDAPYRETRVKVARYAAAGIRAVDMEYMALRAVAAFRGIQLAAILKVSDELFHADWAPGLHTNTFRKESRKMLSALCALFHVGALS
ncbi:MAG: nucleoside phosphorylase [Desulfobulbus sp.]|jgi:uridine phosphorylase